MFTNLIEKDIKINQKRVGTNKRRTLDEINSHLIDTGFECIDNSLKTRKSSPSAFGLYKFPCGHVQEAKHDHVRSGGVRCQTCFLEEKKQEAEKQGLVYLGDDPDKRANYRLYKLPCGHDASLVVSHVSRGVFSELCGNCILKKCEDEADRNNLILVDYSDTSKQGYKKYTYKSCGHTKYMSLYWVARGKVPSCDICTRARWKQEASALGIEMLDIPPTNVRGVNYFNYKLSCGCIKQATTGDVRAQSVGCGTHSTYWNKSATLYLVKFQRLGKEWLKLGVSSNESRRFNEYFRGEDYTLDKILSLSFDSLYLATLFEKAIHKYFKNERICKEELRGIMKSGFNECYPVEMLENIRAKILNDYAVQYERN